MDDTLVFCMAGSSRFKAMHRTVERALTLAGHAVIPLSIYSKSESLYITPAQEEKLVRVWTKKCDLADYVCVVAQGGYIGHHTKGDIEYALDHGKKIVAVPSDAKEDLLQAVPRLTADDIVTLRELGIGGQVAL